MSKTEMTISCVEFRNLERKMSTVGLIGGHYSTWDRSLLTIG